MKKIFVVYGEPDDFYSNPVYKPYELKEGEDLVEAISAYAKVVHADQKEGFQELLEAGEIDYGG